LKIRAKIEQELKGKDGLVKVDFPAKDLRDIGIRQDIHDAFKAERIGDSLFIKVTFIYISHIKYFLNGFYIIQRDGGCKEAIYFRIRNSLESQNQSWWTCPNSVCVVNNRDLRPDVGVWFQRPSHDERVKPIIHPCPPPNVWIEVMYRFLFEKYN